jgi:hypothetical protein
MSSCGGYCKGIFSSFDPPAYLKSIYLLWSRVSYDPQKYPGGQGKIKLGHEFRNKQSYPVGHLLIAVASGKIFKELDIGNR